MKLFKAFGLSIVSISEFLFLNIFKLEILANNRGTQNLIDSNFYFNRILRISKSSLFEIKIKIRKRTKNIFILKLFNCFQVYVVYGQIRHVKIGS